MQRIPVIAASRTLATEGPVCDELLTAHSNDGDSRSSVIADDAVAAQRAADGRQERDPKALERSGCKGRGGVQCPGTRGCAALQAAVRFLVVAADDLLGEPGLELAEGQCGMLVGVIRAPCPVPVLTGIGHERDNTVLDAVAHQRFDTPSKVPSSAMPPCTNAMWSRAAFWLASRQYSG